MARRVKQPKAPSLMREVVANNVAARMEIVFRESRNKPLALSLATGKPGHGGLSLSTIQRVMKGSTGSTIEIYDKVAVALGLRFYQLFVANLDAANPQEIPGAFDAERLVYERSRLGLKSTSLPRSGSINRRQAGNPVGLIDFMEPKGLADERNEDMRIQGAGQRRGSRRPAGSR